MRLLIRSLCEVVILSNVFIISRSFLCPNPTSGPSSSMVQDTCLGRMRSWVQIPAAPPTPTRKGTDFFSFFSLLDFFSESQKVGEGPLCGMSFLVWSLLRVHLNGQEVN